MSNETSLPLTHSLAMQDKGDVLSVSEATKQADVPSGYTALVEYAKIVVPLASGLLAFSIAFMKDILPEPTGWRRSILVVSLLGAIIAVIAGLFGLGHLSRRLRGIRTPIWWINESCLVSLLSYCVAIAMLAVLALGALFREPSIHDCYKQAISHTAKMAKVDEGTLWLTMATDIEAQRAYSYTWEKAPEKTRYTVVISRTDGHLLSFRHD